MRKSPFSTPLLDAVPAAPFRWMVGFEGSFIPQLGVDQYAWTQHDRFWREDFALVRHDLGCTWARYPIPWHLCEPEPGRFDWSWCDERLGHAQDIGLNLVIGLVHFGTPAWLQQSFGDPDFPLALERFTRAFAQRYRDVARFVCPLNEPLNTALFGGEFGLWPPFGRGLSCYCAVLSRVVQGLSRAIKVLREEIPDVEIWMTEGVECPVTEETDAAPCHPALCEPLHVDVARRLERRHLALDLLTGRVDAAHPLHSWLRENGFPLFDLEWFAGHPARIDVLGLDYYPHSEIELFSSSEGHYHQTIPAHPIGLYRTARQYWERYKIPLAISETSRTGSDDDRGAWLEYTLFETRRLRAEGIPILGYTWWPVIDHLDWDGAMLHRTGHIHPVGIYRLQRGPHGILCRVESGLRDAYHELIARGDDGVGALDVAITPHETTGDPAEREMERNMEMPQKVESKT